MSALLILFWTIYKNFLVPSCINNLKKVFDVCSFYIWEKEMATHSSILAWRIPGTAEPGGLPSMGSHIVGHDWSDLAAVLHYSLYIDCFFISSRSLLNFFTHTAPFHWRRRWHPTPELLPGESHEWRSLVGWSPWGREESDTTELPHFHFSLSCIGEGNGNPLQCSCMENPRDGGAWVGCRLWGHTESDTTEAT